VAVETGTFSTLVGSEAVGGVDVAAEIGSAFRQPPSKTRKSSEISRMDLFTDSPVVIFIHLGELYPNARKRS
jgi:hypothetical protein